MSLGFYRVIKGKLVVRERQSPDGGSMRFIANDMSMFEGLPRFTEAKELASGEASYQLRFQAIDTPELHYGGAEQPYGLESRNGLLKWLKVDGKEWDWVVAPKGFEWEHEATILTDGFEGHGRPIAFVFKDLDEDDGSEIKITSSLLAKSYNFHATETGLAYLGFYSGGLAFNIQNDLISAYKKAKTAKKGIWKLDKTKLFTVTNLDDLISGGGSLIYPKIFRRCVDALRWVGGEFEPGRDIDDFLANSIKEDDQFLVHASSGGVVKSRLSDVLEQVNNQIRIQVDLNTVEFVSK
jgi:endonuclease YncB( thermonuclease family)